MAIVRAARPGEVGVLARLWFDGWQDAHANILPAELARLRTLESFHDRLQVAHAATRVADVGTAPAGLAIIRDDELYQLYVAAHARGAGVAIALTEDALALMRQRGVQTAWLACAIGNERAARFYERSGWRQTGTMTSYLPTQAGTFPLDVWRYEIVLSE